MSKTLVKALPAWLSSTGYFAAISLLAVYIVLPGIERVTMPGRFFTGLMMMIAGACLSYFATAFYLNYAQKAAFSEAPAQRLKESVLSLPKLFFTLAIIAAVFSIISGLVSLIIYHVIYSGSIEPLVEQAVNISVACLAVLSLPFIISAFSVYAHGESRLRPLIQGSVRMGAFLYLKYLAVGAIAFGLSYLIRTATENMADPTGILLTIILTSPVLGAFLLIAFSICEKGRAAI